LTHAPSRRLLAAVSLAVAAAVFAAYLPSLGNGFVTWDDREIILGNPEIRRIGWDTLSWMLTTDHMSAYQPLGWLAYALVIRLQGLDPFGFHLASLLVHCLNAWLFFLLSWRLLRAVPSGEPGPAGLARLAGAASAALIFGLHPLQVETVAWATGLPDLLASLFFLTSLAAYTAAWDGRGRGRRGLLALSFAAFAASGLCRWKGVFLPAALAGFHALFPARDREDRTAAWGALAAFTALAGLIVLANTAAKVHGAGYAPQLRLAEAGSGVMLHAWKTLWPSDLIPLTELSAGLGPGRLLPLALTAAVTAWALAAWRRAPAAAVLWLCYLAARVPPFALAGPGPVFAQDLHAYLACGAFHLAAGALLAWALGRAAPAGRTALLAASGAAVLACGVLTVRQGRVWKDGVSLWTHTLAVDEASHPARVNLAAALIDQGRGEEAVIHLREQLARHPDDGVARFALERLLQRLGPVKPSPAHYHNNLGADLFNLGRLEEAACHLSKAVSLDPLAARSHANLAGTLLSLGRTRSAERHRARWLALERTRKPR
jgi:tetratricopeptide (TPR) repeat protein